MNEANMVPNLFDLAAPYGVPGALPEDIPVSVAIIAETPPCVLHRAVVRARSEHGQNRIDASMDLTRVNEESVRGLDDIFTRHHDHMVELTADEATRQQDRLGMLNSVGYQPEAEDLRTAMEALDAAEAARANDPQQEPKLVAAREELVDAMVERANAELDLQRTAPINTLAGEVQKDIERLGRRGRLGTTAAGLLLGTGLGLGLATGIIQNTEGADAAQSASQSSVIEDLSLTSGLVGVAGGMFGFAAGSLLVPRFAQRRASKQLKKARNA